MACNPTRLELSNTDSTVVVVDIATDPGDGTNVVLEIPGLGISESEPTASASCSFLIAARTEPTNSLWDATIQVGANAPANVVVQIVETSANQSVGLNIDDADVSYCAPTAPGGGGVSSLDDLSDVTISLPVAKQVLYYNGADWRNVSLSAGDIPNLDASKTTSGTFDAARIPDLSGIYADASAAVPAGGATGQVLAKASATDYDLTWSTATTGTVTSVGLSVPGGFTVAGTNPITSSGTFEITSTLSGVIVGDGAAAFSGEGVINDLADVNIAMGAGNQDDILYYDHAAGAGSKIKGIARSSIGLSEFDPDLGLGDLNDVTLGLLSDNMFLAYSQGTSRWTGRSPAAARTALGLGTAATTASTDYATAAQGSLADSALQDVVDDTTPQLGGSLDVNGNAIVSASNGNIAITPDGTGKVVLDGLSWPTSDGTADQVLKTDGSGNLSFATVSGGGGGSTDWIRSPSNTHVIRLFDDMLWGTDRNTKGCQFYSLGVSGSYWEDSYGDSVASGETGVVKAQNLSTNSRSTINGPQIYSNAAADGTEFLFEGRFAIQTNPNHVSRPLFVLGAFCPKTEHNSGSTEQGQGYGNTAKAGVYWKKDETYWRSYHYDVEGTNGGTTDADLTSFSLTPELTWFRCAVHCYKDTILTIPTWVVKSYIDGTLAATQYLTSGTEAPTFYAYLYNSGENYISYLYVDWLMLQFTRPNAVSYLDIENL